MLQCPRLVYEIATSTVESMEAKINRYTRKWLGLPSGLSDVALYCRQAKSKLPFKSIVEEFKSGKIRLQTMLDNSKDEVIKSLKPYIGNTPPYHPSLPAGLHSYISYQHLPAVCRSSWSSCLCSSL